MRKSLLVYIKVRVKIKERCSFFIPVIMPLNIVLGVVSYAEDLVSILKPFGVDVHVGNVGSKYGIESLHGGDAAAVHGILRGLRMMLREVMDAPPETFIDVDIQTKNETVGIKLALV